MLTKPAAVKTPMMDGWVNYDTYAVYHVASNSWASRRPSSSQWNSDGGRAYGSIASTGLMIGNNGNGVNAYSVRIHWPSEATTQTSRSIQTLDGSASLPWDPTRSCYLCFGGRRQQLDTAREQPRYVRRDATHLNRQCPTFARVRLLGPFRSMGAHGRMACDRFSFEPQFAGPYYP